MVTKEEYEKLVDLYEEIHGAETDTRLLLMRFALAWHPPTWRETLRQVKTGVKRSLEKLKEVLK